MQSLLEASRKRFDAKFDRAFELGAKNVSVDEQAFAKAALSNMLGIIGFCYGSSVPQKQRKNSTGQEDLQFLDAVGPLATHLARCFQEVSYGMREKVCHERYETILPLAGLLKPTDLRIGAILDALEDPGLFRARAGVRSLSRKDE
ncbi:unnamed protein product [Chondrus crispus]|uniref:mannosyl-oligosaccharide glucosidase n=1 Tax=Chondrus crispus TaxID=2769 RepID=R7Q740_CHOCR|nr:unnamed protein product [Chondrus crispus]CDF34347.1 unnamed protein product [Chondrus crispus]|eukprot:XP_005714166.1 unnamed protein product [Chondrus crispus]